MIKVFSLPFFRDVSPSPSPSRNLNYVNIEKNALLSNGVFIVDSFGHRLAKGMCNALFMLVKIFSFSIQHISLQQNGTVFITEAHNLFCLFLFLFSSVVKSSECTMPHQR